MLFLIGQPFNLSQSFNYTPYLFYKKTLQVRDQFFLYMDPELEKTPVAPTTLSHFPLCITATVYSTVED